jgi:hypothetical protein
MFPNLFNYSLHNQTDATSIFQEFTSVATEPLDDEDFATQIALWFSSGETSSLSYAQQLERSAQNAA